VEAKTTVADMAKARGVRGRRRSYPPPPTDTVIFFDTVE